MSTKSGFSDAERQAMQARAEELRAAKGGNKKAKEAQACLDAIAALPDYDREIAERIHAIVSEKAPDLLSKTWYGMPAYTNDQGKVVCFFKAKSKFEGRFPMLGFEDAANLDDGAMWPTVFAVTELTGDVVKHIEELVHQAAS